MMNERTRRVNVPRTFKRMNHEVERILQKS